MLRFGLRQAGLLLLGLLGTGLLAAAIAAHGASSGYWAALLARIVSLAQCDFGNSLLNSKSAWIEVSARLPATFSLIGAGALIAIVLGTPLGLLLGTGKRMRAAAPLLQIVMATPVFCAGLLLVWIASRVFYWPHAAYTNASAMGALLHGDMATFGKIAWAYALPALTVGAAGAAALQLSLRRAASEAMEEPYRKGLRLMGLPGLEIDRLYLGPQIAAGVLANLGEITLALFSAAAIAEWVFDWPGAAVLFLKSIALHDWNVAALVLLIFATIKLFADFIGALAARALSPGGAQP